jgi:hypothetical protein
VVDVGGTGRRVGCVRHQRPQQGRLAHAVTADDTIFSPRFDRVEAGHDRAAPERLRDAAASIASRPDGRFIATMHGRWMFDRAPARSSAPFDFLAARLPGSTACRRKRDEVVQLRDLLLALF